MVKSLLRWPCLGTSTSIWNNLKVVLQPIKAKVMLLLWCYKSLNIKNYSFPKINLFREEKTKIKFGFSQIWCKNLQFMWSSSFATKFWVIWSKKSRFALFNKKRWNDFRSKIFDFWSQLRWKISAILYCLISNVGSQEKGMWPDFVWGALPDHFYP